MRRIAGRYHVPNGFGCPFASGATATVHLARMDSSSGLARTVAIKRLHPHLASSSELRTLLVDEAKLVSRIAHPNVVQIVEVVEDAREVLLVMEYVHGETLERLARDGERPPPEVAVAIARDILHGLHAAHHARGMDGAPLGLIHRDVSPRNILVSTDGTAKIVDFGIAKAGGRKATTRVGFVRGTLAYMAPEQLEGEPLTNAVDLYGVAVVLWELLTGLRLFDGDTEAIITRRILDHDVAAPGTVVADLPRGLDAAVLRGLARSPMERFGTALEMALALEQSLPPAGTADVAEWVRRAGHEVLAARERELRVLEEAHANATETDGHSESTGATPPAPSLSSAGSRSRARRRAALAVLTMASFVVAAFSIGFRTNATEELASLTGIVNGATTAASSSSLISTSSASATTEAFAIAPLVGSTTEPRPLPMRTSSSAIARALPSNVRAEPTTAPLASSARSHSTSIETCPPYYVDSAGRRRFNRECLR